MNLEPGNAIGLMLGWLAFGALLALAVYPFYRLKAARWKYRFGGLRAWRTWHLYGGAVFFAFMLLHTGFAWPSGKLTTMIWLASFLVSIGGALWFGAQIYVPRKLAQLGDTTLFERITEKHKFLLSQGERLAKDDGHRIARLYEAEWLPRMGEIKFSPRHLHAATIDALQPIVAAQRAFLTEAEREVLKTLHEIYMQKLALEASYSLQLVLRRFNFVHGPLAFIMLALALVHVASVVIF